MSGRHDPDEPLSIEEFRERAGHPFALDRFQVEAVEALRDERSVLVAAPTGSGKTVVADYAVERAVTEGVKIFYTTPVKALSNQKYHDLVAAHGAARVGLLTGTTPSTARPRWW
ncbi:MAG: DEAD/DEAH box helicase [Acidimicrobiia bacterium]|nr:DEAD/DEAH box helicase [Acidimicrobiia bacterium]